MPPHDRLDYELLDDQDPFELDSKNRPHLFSHDTFSEDDLFDVWSSDPLFFPAKDEGAADWLMVAEVPGGDILLVPSRSRSPVTRPRRDLSESIGPANN
jgi:hypothetical protein